MKTSLCLFFLCCLSASAQVANPRHLPFSWQTDTSKHTQDLSEFAIAAKKDEIPTLDYPAFIHHSDPAYNYYAYEPVIAIHEGNRARAYPLSVLTLYELANDSFGGRDIMVTFCPACNAALVYNRSVTINQKTQVLHFGVSGLLVHNDMVMYDRETQSWWEQLMGTATVGSCAGTELEMLPAMLISVHDFFDRFPDGEILSPDKVPFAGHHHHRPFYHLEHGHHGMDTAFYLPEHTDPRLPPLERVLDIHHYGHTTIYPFHQLAKHHVINETFENVHFCIFYHGNVVSVMDKDNLKHSRHTGSAVAFRRILGSDTFRFYQSGEYFKDSATHSTWDITGYCRDGVHKGKQLHLMPHSNHFAFAWLAFHPESVIWEGK